MPYVRTLDNGNELWLVVRREKVKDLNEPIPESVPTEIIEVDRHCHGDFAKMMTSDRPIYEG